MARALRSTQQKLVDVLAEQGLKPSHSPGYPSSPLDASDMPPPLMSGETHSVHGNSKETLRSMEQRMKNIEQLVGSFCCVGVPPGRYPRLPLYVRVCLTSSPLALHRTR